MSSNVSVIYFPLLKAALNKRAPIEEVELYFNLSEKVRHFTEDYFQLETPLYFSYTHLVCRSSIVGEFNRFNRLVAGGGGGGGQPRYQDTVTLGDGVASGAGFCNWIRKSKHS